MCAIALGISVLAIPAVLTTTPAAEAGNGTTVRPISDFLEAQQLSYTSTTPPLFRSGIVDWVSEGKDGEVEWRMRVDFLGIIDRDFIQSSRAWGTSIGSTFSGKVTEKVQKDGRTLVHVTLHGKDVLCFVGKGLNLNPFTVVWGNHAGWANFQGWSLDTLDTADVHYELRFLTDDEPGSQLPQLTELLFFPRPDQEVVQQLITVSGDGRLRALYGVADGTPGKVSMTMKHVNNASFDPSAEDPKRDPWPVARIDLRPAGN
jgi:hypothetical protein